MKIEIHSDTWKDVSGWATARLDKARAALESDATGHEQTLALRAQIKLLKALLELPNDASTTTESEVAFGIEPP